MELNASFENYIAQEDSVRGPMPIECAYLIAAVMRGLNRLDVRGDMMEIGVFEGRSAIPAASFLRGAEEFYCIDPFGDIKNASATLTYGGVGDDEQFVANWKRLFGATQQLRILRTTSEAVAQNDAITREWQPFKYISVDGDHSYEGTLLDLELAARLIAELGIIAIDDVFNVEWPSVSQALNTFLSKTSEFVPFCLGWGRLFLCKQGFFEEIKKETKAVFETFEGRAKKHLRILEPFEYYGALINVYTNRWGSASKPALDVEGYRVGSRYLEIEDTHPEIAKQVKKLLFG